MQGAEQALLFFETKNFNVLCLQRRPVGWRKVVELEAGIEGEYQNGSSLSQGLMLVILIWWMDGGAVLSLRKSVTSTEQKKNE